MYCVLNESLYNEIEKRKEWMKHKHLILGLLVLGLLFNDKTQLVFSWNDTVIMEIVILAIALISVYLCLKNVDKLKSEM